MIEKITADVKEMTASPSITPQLVLYNVVDIMNGYQKVIAY